VSEIQIYVVAEFTLQISKMSVVAEFTLQIFVEQARPLHSTFLSLSGLTG